MVQPLRRELGGQAGRGSPDSAGVVSGRGGAVLTTPRAGGAALPPAGLRNNVIRRPPPPEQEVPRPRGGCVVEGPGRGLGGALARVGRGVLRRKRRGELGHCPATCSRGDI